MLPINRRHKCPKVSGSLIQDRPEQSESTCVAHVEGRIDAPERSGFELTGGMVGDERLELPTSSV